MSTVNRLQGVEGRPQRNVSDPTGGKRDAVLKNVHTCSAAQQTSYSKFTGEYFPSGEEAGA